MFDLVTRLNEECGVRLPKKDDQDWEFCAGDYTRTEDYIEFYLIPQNSNRFCNSKEGTNPAVTVTKRQA